MTAADAHLDTGAAALDALPGGESIDFLAHLEDCGSCSLELREFRETAARLGAAVSAPAPDSLRRSVLAAIAVTPQLPPLAPPTTSNNVVPLRRPWYRRAQTLLVAAAAVLLLAGGTAIVLSRGTAGTTAESCVQTASDVQTFTPAVGSGGVVAYASSCQVARVTPAGLAPLPADEVYQLWVLDSKGAARSVGVLKTTTTGVQPMDAAIQPGDTSTAISVEKAPGPAASPSKTIVWVTAI